MKLLTTTLLLAVLSALGATAQTQNRWYIVDASKPEVPLAVMAEVAFLMTSDWDEGITIVNKNGTLSSPLTTITFRQLDPTTIATPEQNRPTLYSGLVGQTIVLSNCKAGTPVAVFSLKGEKLCSQTACDGKTEVNVGDLAEGIYLLKVGDITIKFRKGGVKP